MEYFKGVRGYTENCQEDNLNSKSVWNTVPELMDDFPPRGPPRPRPPDMLRPRPPGRRLLSRWCLLSLSSSPAKDQSLSSSFLSDSVSEGLESSEFVPCMRRKRKLEINMNLGIIFWFHILTEVFQPTLLVIYVCY